MALDTFTQLTATFDLTSVPQGVYSVVVSKARRLELGAGRPVHRDGRGGMGSWSPT